MADDLTLFAASPNLTCGEVDVGDLLRQTAQAVAELAEECGVAVELDLAAALDPVKGDAPKLLLAVVNLARNGIEAMGPGAFGEPLGESGPVRQRRLELAGRQELGRLVLEVRDRGAGLPAEVRDRLFEPFVTTKRSGTGLGLAIAWKVVEAHGGWVEAQDRAGGGSLFRVVLPAEGERP